MSDTDNLLDRFAELLVLVKSGKITSLAWVASDEEGDVMLGAAGDAQQLVEAVEQLRDAVREAPAAKRGVA